MICSRVALGGLVADAALAAGVWLGAVGAIVGVGLPDGALGGAGEGDGGDGSSGGVLQPASASAPSSSALRRDMAGSTDALQRPPAPSPLPRMIRV